MMRTLILKERLLTTPFYRIKEQMKFFNISKLELCEKLGLSELEFHELSIGKKAIDKPLAIKLETLFGVDKSFWLNLQKHYHKELRRIRALQEVVSKQKLAGWLYYRTYYSLFRTKTHQI